ncbi:MAG: Hsp20/alpha crystallin family protein, partial [Clostridia bacterium]|nr:Hsp20/alpha crystallin family protein [Clostridia bacterium]
MSLIRWDPWRELEKARRELDRLFDRVLEKTRGGEGWLGGGWPSVDVYERGGDVVVEIELPGVDPENIRLEVNEDSVFVEAERREDKETQGEGLYRR